MRYEIVPASPLHVGPNVRRMPDTVARIEAQNGRPRALLRKRLSASFAAWTALVDGSPLLMWGLIGSPLGSEVILWANFTDEVRCFPLTLAREARKEVARLLEVHVTICAAVLADDERAQRFARFLGFEVGTGPIDDGGALYLPVRLAR